MEPTHTNETVTTHSEFMEKLRATREYCTYLEKHYESVQKVFHDMEVACKNFSFMYDEHKYIQLKAAVLKHDLSKLSHKEFIQYREYFFPTDTERKLTTEDRRFENFYKAYTSHLECNTHHPSPARTAMFRGTAHIELSLVHMVIDWVAMADRSWERAYKKFKQDKPYRWSGTLKDADKKFIESIFKIMLDRGVNHES